MQLVPLNDNQLEITISGRSASGHHDSLWDVRYDPTDYQQLLDYYLVASSFSQYLTHNQNGSRHDNLCSDTFKDYLNDIQLRIPSDDLDAFTAHYYGIIEDCYAFSEAGVHCYATTLEISWNGRQYQAVCTPEDVEMMVLRAYIHWKYHIRQGGVVCD